MKNKSSFSLWAAGVLLALTLLADIFAYKTNKNINEAAIKANKPERVEEPKFPQFWGAYLVPAFIFIQGIYILRKNKKQ